MPAAPQGPTTLTTDALVDTENADAADVLVPFNEAEAAIDEARTTVAVSGDDSTVGYLEDKIVGGEGVTVAVQNSGGNEILQIVATIAAVPTGTILPFIGGTAPSGFLMMYGQLVSITTYLALLLQLLSNSSYVLTLDSGEAATCDNATNLITDANHGLSNGTVVLLTASSMPSGLATATPYYVINASTNDFQLSLTEGGAAVDFTTNGSGVLYHQQFALPDARGRALVGVDNQGGSSANRITASAADSVLGSGGEEAHTLTIDEIPSHTHPLATNIDGMPGSVPRSTFASASSVNTGSTGGGMAHNNLQPYLAVNWIIRY